MGQQSYFKVWSSISATSWMRGLFLSLSLFCPLQSEGHNACWPQALGEWRSQVPASRTASVSGTGPGCRAVCSVPWPGCYSGCLPLALLKEVRESSEVSRGQEIHQGWAQGHTPLALPSFSANPPSFPTTLLRRGGDHAEDSPRALLIQRNQLDLRLTPKASVLSVSSYCSVELGPSRRGH